MLCLSNFELYSRWMPLTVMYFFCVIPPSLGAKYEFKYMIES